MGVSSTLGARSDGVNLVGRTRAVLITSGLAVSGIALVLTSKSFNLCSALNTSFTLATTMVTSRSLYMCTLIIRFELDLAAHLF